MFGGVVLDHGYCRWNNQYLVHVEVEALIQKKTMVAQIFEVEKPAFDIPGESG